MFPSVLFGSTITDPADRAVMNLPCIRELATVTHRRARQSRELVRAERASLRSDLIALVEHGRTVRIPARRPIWGGSQLEPLRERICDRLADGTLPRLSGGRSWAGPATGQRCTVCDGRIEPPAIEYEIDDPRGPIFVHFACFHLWSEESRLPARQVR